MSKANFIKLTVTFIKKNSAFFIGSRHRYSNCEITLIHNYMYRML